MYLSVKAIFHIVSNMVGGMGSVVALSPQIVYKYVSIEHISSMVTANDARYGRKILNDLPYLGRMVACIS